MYELSSQHEILRKFVEELPENPNARKNVLIKSGWKPIYKSTLKAPYVHWQHPNQEKTITSHPGFAHIGTGTKSWHKNFQIAAKHLKSALPSGKILNNRSLDKDHYDLHIGLKGHIHKQAQAISKAHNYLTKKGWVASSDDTYTHPKAKNIYIRYQHRSFEDPMFSLEH